MKRTLKKLVSAIIIFSIILSVFAITSFADSETYNSSADKYFSELKINFPENVAGSCGYVAMSMLLGYYDTYWSDSFVDDDQYDKSVAYTESALRDGYSTIRTENNLFSTQYNEYKASGGTLSRDEYYVNFVTQHQSEGYLHLDLIGMGIDEGYYDGIIQREEYLITLYEIGSLFEKYFKSIFGESYYFDPYGFFCPPNVSVPIKINYLSMLDGHSYNVVINKMSELVDAGIPVIYFGSSYEYSDTALLPEVEGHFMIAYDTVKINGEIDDFIMHTGWSNKTGSYKYCNKLSELPYDKNVSILWFEINESMIPHSCSDNYVFAGGETACSCELYGDLHPSHEHKPANGAEMCPSASKTADCICGEKVNGAHRYTTPSYTSSGHRYQCACGEYTEMAPHVLSIQSESNALHVLKCSCGYKTGAEQHNFVKQSAQYSICTECGYTRDHFGENENIHLGTEEKEETE